MPEKDNHRAEPREALREVPENDNHRAEPQEALRDVPENDNENPRAFVRPRRLLKAREVWEGEIGR